VGIGYRADVKGKLATFTLGYSHPIEVVLPDGVDLKIDEDPRFDASRTTSTPTKSRTRAGTRLLLRGDHESGLAAGSL